MLRRIASKASLIVVGTWKSIKRGPRPPAGHRLFPRITHNNGCSADSVVDSHTDFSIRAVWSDDHCAYPFISKRVVMESSALPLGKRRIEICDQVSAGNARRDSENDKYR